MSEPTPLAIVGPTASGKTSLAMALAEGDDRLECLSVDALACYRRLDVGTAKPTPEERLRVRWHLLDLVEPDREYSVAAFVRAAEEAREDLATRRGRGVLVGGSSLYLRAVIDGLEPPPRYPDLLVSLQLEADELGIESLHARLATLDPLAASRMEPSNERRVLRALEVTLGSGRPFSSYGPGLDVHLPTPIRLLGLEHPRDELDRRLEMRFDAQLRAGFVEEVAALERDGVVLSRTAAQAIGYRELAAVVRGEATMDQARAAVLRRSRSLVRRQLQWLRRDPRIEWVDATRADLVEVASRMLDEASSVHVEHDPV